MSSSRPDPALDAAVATAAGSSEPINVALMHILLAAPSETAARAALAVATVSDRVTALAALLDACPGAFDRLAAIRALEQPTRGGAASPALCKTLFDRAAEIDEGAAVALYALGRADLLAAATGEIIASLAADDLLSPASTVLDFGCGAGRLMAALAPRVGRVVGVELSARMAEAAGRAIAEDGNAMVVRGDGRDLSFLVTGGFDLIVALDSFPYVAAEGEERIIEQLAEFRRLLAGGGRVRILNYAYAGDHADRARSIARLAAVAGLRVLAARPGGFAHWDGELFDLAVA